VYGDCEAVREAARHTGGPLAEGGVQRLSRGKSSTTDRAVRAALVQAERDPRGPSDAQVLSLVTADGADLEGAGSPMTCAGMWWGDEVTYGLTGARPQGVRPGSLPAEMTSDIRARMLCAIRVALGDMSRPAACTSPQSSAMS